ncbi:MAG: polymer-forming cytoskeletal protein [Methanoculleaceae archaeon]
MGGDAGGILSRCNIPDGTELQERTLKTGQDIIIGDRSRIDYGLSGRDVIVCEFSTINGSINAGRDLRLDNWCTVTGPALAGEDAYLGEGVKIGGRLVVRGDLDIGDNVSLTQGFEAKGWISIRNPMPVVTYLLLYIMALLGLEREDELDAILEGMAGGGEESGRPLPLTLPAGSILNTELFSVPAPVTIGSGCRLHGNIRADSVSIGEETVIFGSVRAKGGVSIDGGTRVHGNVETSGPVVLKKDAGILGDVVCDTLTMDDTCRVEGVIRAPGGLRLVRGR